MIYIENNIFTLIFKLFFFLRRRKDNCTPNQLEEGMFEYHRSVDCNGWQHLIYQSNYVFVFLFFTKNEEKETEIELKILNEKPGKMAMSYPLKPALPDVSANVQEVCYLTEYLSLLSVKLYED